MKTMKWILLISITMLVCVACSSKASKTEQQPDSTAMAVPEPQVLPVAVQTLNGYFLKNNFKLTEDLTVLMFADKASFDKALGVAKTMANKVDAPDFQKNVITAIALKSTKQKTEIVMGKAEKIGEMINVYFDVKVGENLTYTMLPVAVYSFPKEEGVSTVNFMKGGMAVKSFSLNGPATNK